MSNNEQYDSPGQFEEFTEQFMTYTASSQLSPVQKNSLNKLSVDQSTQKPKLKIMEGSSHKNKYSQEGLLNLTKKTKKFSTNNCKIIAIGDVIFRSNFESGNLDTVEKVAPSTYEIRMTKELNSERLSSWFYFIVEGIKGQAKFIIKGFTKSSSLFNQGMKVCYREAQQAKWRRGGTKIMYTDSYNDNEESRTTYQVQFSYFFKSNYPNSVQFAYCFPYTYTNLIKFISLHQTKVRFETLGKTYEGREIPLLTIGNQDSEYVVILSARAHPGETVGSHMMEGFLKEIISDNQYSTYLRQAFCFKIVPMINPDGVCNGNYRFSGSGYDLNRKWRTCTSKMHPEVYYFKQKIRQISKQKQIIMFIDLHGHSRQKNVFFYGCSSRSQNIQNEMSTPNTKSKQFPFLMSKLHSAFRYDYCSYAMQKQKQGTARITMWNQLKIDYIYTLEASLCGTDISNFLISDYEKVGAKLCQGICLHFWDKIQQKIKEKNHGQQNTQIQNKINQQLKKNMNQFFANPQLANIQFNGNSSDSEPQAGQIPQNQRQNKKQKSAISVQKYYKAARIMKFSQKNIFEQDSSLLKSKQNYNNKIQLNMRNKTNESTRMPRSSADNVLGIQLKSEIKNLSTELTMKTRDQFFARAELLNKTINQRLRVQSQKYTQPIENRMISEPFGLRLGEDDDDKLQGDKNKKKAVSFEGAQYRRVRKLAQQHNRRHFSAQHSGNKGDQTLIRGLVGMNNLLQLQRTSSKQQRAPSFFPNNSFHTGKARKGTAEMHFRRQIRASDYTSRRLYVNGLEKEVKCFGKQIL